MKIKVQEITTKGKISEATIIILDSMNNEVLSTNRDSPKGIYSLDRSLLSTGNYVLRISKTNYIEVNLSFYVNAEGKIGLKVISAKNIGKKYQVKLKGNVITIQIQQNLQLFVRFVDLPNEPFKVTYSNGIIVTGSLDANGQMKLDKISYKAEYCDVHFTNINFIYRLNYGLESVKKIRGVQSRLNALGYWSWKVDGIKGWRTTSAIMQFQDDEGLKVDGIPGEDETQPKLIERYDHGVV